MEKKMAYIEITPEQKEQLINAWETAFDIPLKDRLNEAGIKKLESDTNYCEVLGLLTTVAIDDFAPHLIDSVLSDLSGAVVAAVVPSTIEEKSKGKPEYKATYKIYKEDEAHPGNGVFFKEEFGCFEEAHDALKELAQSTRYRLDELSIVKVFKHEKNN